jgi:predicted kinase
MLLIALAGLPGTGKSALAHELVACLGCPCFDKDRVREAIFGPKAVEYSAEQDDVVVRALFASIASTARTRRFAHAILDGRTFTRRAHVLELQAFGEEHAIEIALVECQCRDDIARARIERDREHGAHVARNRDLDLYTRLRAARELIEIQHVVLDTDERSPAELARALIATLGLA